MDDYKNSETVHACALGHELAPHTRLGRELAPHTRLCYKPGVGQTRCGINQVWDKPGVG